jgi:hypothetical protein
MLRFVWFTAAFCVAIGVTWEPSFVPRKLLVTKCNSSSLTVPQPAVTFTTQPWYSLSSMPIITTNQHQVCMIHQNTSVVCADHSHTYTLSSGAPPKLLSLEDQHTCMVYYNNTIVCIQQQPSVLQRSSVPYPSVQIQRLVSGHAHSCVLYVTGVVACFGSNQQDQLVVPSLLQGQFVTISAGMFHTCATTVSYYTVCWGGTNGWGERSVPPVLQGVSSSVAAGGYHTCVISTQALLQCFGWNGYGQQLVPTAFQRRVQQVATGWAHTCVTTHTGSFGCFGWNADAQCTVPLDSTGALTTALGKSFSCCMAVSQVPPYPTIPTCWGSIKLTGCASAGALPLNVSLNASVPVLSSCQMLNLSNVPAQSCSLLPSQLWSCNAPTSTNMFTQVPRFVGRLPAGTVCALECVDSIPQGPPILICDINGKWTPALRGNMSSLTPLVAVVDVDLVNSVTFSVDCAVLPNVQQDVSLWAVQPNAEELCITSRQLFISDLRLEACGSSWTFSYAVAASDNTLASAIIPWSSNADAIRQAASLSRLSQGTARSVSVYGALFVGQTDAMNIVEVTQEQALGMSPSEIIALDDTSASVHPVYAVSVGEHELRTVLVTPQSISVTLNISLWVSQLSALIASVTSPVSSARLGLVVLSHAACADIGWQGVPLIACSTSARASTDVDVNMAGAFQDKLTSSEISAQVAVAAPCTYAALSVYTGSIYSGLRKSDSSIGTPSIVVVSNFPSAQIWVVGWVNSYYGLACTIQSSGSVQLAGPKVYNASAVYFDVTTTSTADTLVHYPCSCSLIRSTSGVAFHFGADIVSMSARQPSLESIAVAGRRLDATSVSKAFELNVRGVVQLTFTLGGDFTSAADVLSVYAITIGGVDVSATCIGDSQSTNAVSFDCTSPAVSAVCNASKTGDCGTMLLRLSPISARSVGQTEMIHLEGGQDSTLLEMAIKAGTRRILSSVVCPPACPGIETTSLIPSAHSVGPSALSFSDELLPLVYVVPPALRPQVGAGIKYLYPCSAADFESPSIGGCTGATCAYGAGDSCVPCPTGAICGAGYALLAQPGYWNPSGTGSTIVQCKPPASSRCIGAAVDGRPLCGLGYSSSSSACSACDKGYYADEQSNECLPCEHSVIGLAKPWLVLIVCVGALCAVGAFLGKATQSCRSNSQQGHALGSLLFVGSAWTSLEANSILARLHVAQLPNAISPWYSFLSVFTFGNLDPACPASSPFASAQAVLVIGVILLVLALLCGALVWGRGSSGRENVLEKWYDELPGVLGTLITLFAGAAAVTVFSTFDCEDAFVDVRTYLTMNSDGSSLGELQANAAKLYECVGDFGETTACQSVQQLMDTVLSVRVHATYGSFVCLEGQHWLGVQSALAAMVVIFILIPSASLIANICILRKYISLRVTRLASLNTQHQRSLGHARHLPKPALASPLELASRHWSLRCTFSTTSRLQMARNLAEARHGEHVQLSAAKLTAFVDSLQRPYPAFSRAVMGVSYRLSAFPMWSAHMVWLGFVGSLHAWGEPSSVGEAVGQLLYILALTGAAVIALVRNHPISMTHPFAHSIYLLSCAL